MAAPQLTSFVVKGENDPLISQSPSPVPVPVPDSKSSVRFQVEHVFEEETTVDSVDGLSPSVQDVSMGEHTFGYRTLDAAPTSAYYKDSLQPESERRPTIRDLMEGERSMPGGELENSKDVREDIDRGELKERNIPCLGRCCRRTEPKKQRKFGWIMGVLIRCMLNIWGIMLFRRLSWVTGQAGIGLAALIVLLSMAVTILTTLSMSAITTNGEIKGGGAYYLISRSLGPEFGGAIGIIFALANAVAISLYVVGFAETAHDLIRLNGGILTGDRDNDIRVIGILVLIALLGIALIGLDWEAIVQLIMLVILLISIGSLFLGMFIPPMGHLPIYSYSAFQYFSGDTIVTNLGPDFRSSSDGSPDDGEASGGDGLLSFFIVFGVFFPAATGILAGANISGDLKNPQKAIPRGTLLAILITGITYLVVAIVIGMVVLRETLHLPSCINNTYLEVNFPSHVDNYCDSLTGVFNPYNSSNSLTSFYRRLCSTLRNEEFSLNSTRERLTCSNGLIADYDCLTQVSILPPVIYAGIFAATLSSALTSLISAPKVFQRVCQDRIFPYISFFAKGGGRSGTEPIRGYFLAFGIAIIFILIGNLNNVAPIISNFFLMAYTLINYSCFVASFTETPGWRPAFKYYNKWLSLFAAVLCFAIMFIINWYTALPTVVLVIALYGYVWYKKPDVNWGSSGQAFWYLQTMHGLKKLEAMADHVKNYRPHFLLLSGRPSSRPDLIKFSSQIIGNNGIIICGDVLKAEVTYQKQQRVQESQTHWLKQNKIRAFYNCILSSNLHEGCLALYQMAGLGKLKPNTVLLGFKNNWKLASVGEVEEYVKIVQDAFEFNMGVCIFRLRAGFDTTEKSVQSLLDKTNHLTLTPRPSVDVPRPSVDIPSRQQSGNPLESQPLLGRVEEDVASGLSRRVSGVQLVPPSHASVYVDLGMSTYHKPTSAVLSPINDTQASVNSYAAAIEEGEVDLASNYSNEDTPTDPTYKVVTMPSRFSQNQGEGTIDVYWLYDDGGLSLLLPYLLSQNSKWSRCQLRIFTASSTRHIDSATLRMTTLLRKFRINVSSVTELQNIAKPMQESIDKYKECYRGVLGMTFESRLDPKTLRHIRLGELLRENSSEAKLIVVSISVPPRKGLTITAHQYMSWLDVVSADLPPTLLMRGNQQSVLTFYS